MKIEIIEDKNNYFISWNDELIKVKTLPPRYARRYGGAMYLLECDEKFTYEDFKHLSGEELPENFCVTSYCRISFYMPVFIVYISRLGAELLYRFTTTYDLDKWKEDVHLGKFCERLHESFSLAGLRTENKPELEEYSYHIPVTISQTSEKKIQDVVEGTCEILSEIHDSVFDEVCNKQMKQKSQLPLSSQGISTNDEQNLEIIDGVKLTKYKGKFFEIDLPKLAGKIISRKKA